jgi:hypothetical protein
MMMMLLLIIAAACGGRDAEQVETTTASESVAPAAMTPEQLGELGARIRKEPARARELLAERGLSEEAFEKAIREVTENPDASRRYAAAYRRASS